MTPAGRERDLQHLRIGRLVRDLYTAKLNERREDSAENYETDLMSLSPLVVAAVEHLNKVSHCLRDNAERIGLVQLNLTAAYAAERNSSFLSASKFLAQARSLLKTSDEIARNDWKYQPELTLEVFNASAEIEHACGNFKGALDFARTVTCRVDGVAKLRATHVIVECLGVQLRIHEAIDEALLALSLVGESIPRRLGNMQIRREVAKLKRSLRIRTSADLMSLPEMKDSSKREAVRFC